MKAGLSLLFLSLSFHIQFYAQDLDLVNLLPSAVNESSGLVFLEEKLITHLDSDGANALFEIDSTDASIIRTVYISNAANIDWEDITIDDAYIYIGDFGNNSGSRTDLRVYKVAIQDYLNTANDTVLADTISYAYENQVDFTPGSNNTDFDAEAMISFGDSLLIFSKNWLSNTCDVYALSKSPGMNQAYLLFSFDSEGLITGAHYDELSHSLFLTGYGPPIPFVLHFSFTGFPMAPLNFQKYLVQVPIGSSVQIEAITSQNSQKLFVSSESSVLGDASLMTIDTRALVSIHDVLQKDFIIYPNPSNDELYIDLEENEYVELYDNNGHYLQKIESKVFHTLEIPSGVYYLLLKDYRGLIIAQQSFLIAH